MESSLSIPAKHENETPSYCATGKTGRKLEELKEPLQGEAADGFFPLNSVHKHMSNTHHPEGPRSWGTKAAWQATRALAATTIKERLGYLHEDCGRATGSCPTSTQTKAYDPPSLSKTVQKMMRNGRIIWMRWEKSDAGLFTHNNGRKRTISGTGSPVFPPHTPSASQKPFAHGTRLNFGDHKSVDCCRVMEWRIFERPCLRWIHGMDRKRLGLIALAGQNASKTRILRRQKPWEAQYQAEKIQKNSPYLTGKHNNIYVSIINGH